VSWPDIFLFKNSLTYATICGAIIKKCGRWIRLKYIASTPSKFRSFPAASARRKNTPDLKNTSKISQMCQEATEPIYITKNGYGDMVIMSVKVYEEKMFMMDVYNKLAAAEVQVAEGKVLDGGASLKSIRGKYNI